MGAEIPTWMENYEVREDITVRKMTDPAEAEKFLEIERSSGNLDELTDPAIVKDGIKKGWIYQIKAGEINVGTICCIITDKNVYGSNPNDKVAHIFDLAVRPLAQRLGIASYAIEEIIRGLDKKIRRVELFVDMDNKAAIDMYSKIGFKTESIEPNEKGRHIMKLFLDIIRH